MFHPYGPPCMVYGIYSIIFQQPSNAGLRRFQGTTQTSPGAIRRSLGCCWWFFRGRPNDKKREVVITPGKKSHLKQTSSTFWISEGTFFKTPSMILQIPVKGKKHTWRICVEKNNLNEGPQLPRWRLGVLFGRILGAEKNIGGRVTEKVSIPSCNQDKQKTGGESTRFFSSTYLLVTSCNLNVVSKYIYIYIYVYTLML